MSKLRPQLIFTFLTGSLAIVVAIGIPAVLIINRQAASQTRLLLNQATLTTQASLARELSDLQNLALLISQRPTLRRYLEDQETLPLGSYLNTLRESVDLDLLIICNANGEAIGGSPIPIPSGLCSVDDVYGFLPASQDTASLMFATSTLQTSSSFPYKVILGKHSSSAFAQLQEETGLLYFLLSNNQIVEASDPQVDMKTTSVQDLIQRTSPDFQQSSGEGASDLDGKMYVFSTIPLASLKDLHLIGALNVDEQVRAQANLRRTLLLGLILVVLIAFGMGIWLSQRFSSPLNHLAIVASDFSHGDLQSPVTIQSGTWEIKQLANTLEDARVALQHSMEQLRSEKAWVEHILNSIIEGILTLDNHNRITFASARMNKIADEESEQMIGRKIDDIFLPVESEISISEQLPAADHQQNISVQLKHGQEKLLSISRAKLVPPEARSSSHVLVIRDVSNEEYIHRLLGDFLANITHEFRTPLAALEASSELLLDNLQQLSQSELEELLISLNLGIIDLQTLIDNLIEAASIEAGRFKVSLQPIDFDLILGEALKVIQPLSKKYGLNLVISSHGKNSVLVMADPRRTVQVLVNLLSNAIKHSPEFGRIQVEYYVEGLYLRVEVIDKGSGIPMDKRSILFKKFSHLDSTNGRARQGAGLGLSVVKAIVEAQHGEVGVEDHAQHGTSFWFTLPLAGEAGI